MEDAKRCISFTQKSTRAMSMSIRPSALHELQADLSNHSYRGAATSRQSAFWDQTSTRSVPPCVPRCPSLMMLLAEKGKVEQPLGNRRDAERVTVHPSKEQCTVAPKASDVRVAFAMKKCGSSRPVCQSRPDRGPSAASRALMRALRGVNTVF